MLGIYSIHVEMCIYSYIVLWLIWMNFRCKVLWFLPVLASGGFLLFNVRDDIENKVYIYIVLNQTQMGYIREHMGNPEKTNNKPNKKKADYWQFLKDVLLTVCADLFYIPERMN